MCLERTDGGPVFASTRAVSTINPEFVSLPRKSWIFSAFFPGFLRSFTCVKAFPVSFSCLSGIDESAFFFFFFFRDTGMPLVLIEAIQEFSVSPENRPILLKLIIFNSCIEDRLSRLSNVSVPQLDKFWKILNSRSNCDKNDVDTQFH